jgi:ElaB/YqjD/DUF883 family membrane-anchored ribosome-binding protein
MLGKGAFIGKRLDQKPSQDMEIFFKNITPEQGTTEQLLEDLNTLREDTEELFRATAGTLAERSKSKFLNSVERMKATCNDLRERTSTHVQDVEETLRQYPYSAVGVALGIGIIIGFLSRRK